MPKKPKGSDIEGFIRWAYAVCALVMTIYSKRSKSPDKKKKSVQDLYQVINDISKVNGRGEITVMLGTNEKWFLALVMRKQRGEGHLIILNPAQKPTELRLSSVQESFQVLLDDKRLRSTNLGEALDDYLVFLRSRNVKVATKPTYGEFIAELAAMEALFPYQDRQQVLKGAAVSSLSQRKIGALAQKYGVPTRCVRYYLRKDIMKELKKYHEPQPKRAKPSRKQR